MQSLCRVVRGYAKHSSSLLAAGLLLSSCDSAGPAETEEQEEEPQAVYTVTGSDMGAVYQNLNILRDGVPLAGADVKVNGVAIPAAASAGSYYGPIPAVDPGGSIVLEVRSGADVVRGTDVMPAIPAVMVPADGETMVEGTAVTVQWTSTSDPDRFTVTAQYSCGAGCGTSRDYAVNGNVRSYTIPAADLPVGEPIQIQVFAYNDGTFTGPVSTDSHMSVRGEGPGPEITVEPPLVYTVTGGDMSGVYQSIFVVRNGVPLAGADVRVNGTVIPETAGAGSYYGTVAAVATGEPIALEIRFGTELVTGTDVMPEVVTLTAPADNATFAASNEIVVNWSSTTSPSRFVVVAQYSCGTNCGAGKTWNAAGDARTFSIAAGELPSGQPISIQVFSYNDGVFTGPVSAESRMSIRGEGPGVTVTITP